MLEQLLSGGKERMPIVAKRATNIQVRIFITHTHTCRRTTLAVSLKGCRLSLSVSWCVVKMLAEVSVL